MIPDYILRKELRVVDKFDKVTYWMQIDGPPPPRTSWREYLGNLMRDFAHNSPSEVLGFRIHVRFYQSISLERALDTLSGVPVKWKMRNTP